VPARHQIFALAEQTTINKHLDFSHLSPEPHLALFYHIPEAKASDF